MEKFYGPEEDTFQMIETLKEIYKNKEIKKSLEIGIGNGQISKYISTISNNHTGVDINPFAIEETKKICNKGNYFESNLFENINDKYDLIIFNPPYLPNDKKLSDNDWIDKAIYGGKKGNELIIKFLKKLPKYLNEEGTCLLLFSKLSKPEEILELVNNLFLNHELVSTKSYMMEELYIYEISKNKTRTKLESKNYQDIKFFAKGSHGKVFTAKKDDQLFGIKILNEKSAAKEAIQKEAEKLQFVNKLNIGPKFIEFNKELNYLIYEFVEGEPWQKTYSKFTIQEIKEVILDVLDQAYRMDKAGFEKKEMQRPNKNLLITKNKKPILIDFERGILTDKPSNVTQFLQYLTNSKFSLYIKEKGIKFERNKIIKLGLEYKNNFNIANVKEYVEQKFNKT